MNTDYRDKYLLDVTDPQEPDSYDKPIELPCYEKWIDGLQSSNEQLNEMGEDYGH